MLRVGHSHVLSRAIASAELERARTQFRERRRAQLADATGAADLLDAAFALATSAALEDVRTEWRRDYARVDGIDAADLAELAQQYLRPAQRAVVVAGDLDRFRTALERWNEEIDLFAPSQVIERLRRRRGFFVPDP